MLTFRDIKKAIVESLSPDLLTPYYRAQLAADDPVETGHCAIASEAFYHIAGGREAGFIPVVCGYDAPSGERETHWWVRGPKNGQRGAGDVFDVTVAQYKDGFDYRRGHNTGFMQPQQKPSKRAQVIIDRVMEKLGVRALAAYRQANIRAYRLAQKKMPSVALRRNVP